MCQICEKFLNLLTDSERAEMPTMKAITLQVLREHPEGLTTEQVGDLGARKVAAIVVYRQTMMERPCRN